MMAGKAKMIERVPDLRSQVYDRLRESIRTGQIATDARLVETTVANDYGVSRTPAREALAMLVRDGLLVQEGRGFSLPNHSRQDIFDVFEVRMSLEPQAMRRLAETITSKQVRTVKALAETTFSHEIDAVDYARALGVARGTLFEMAGNERLRQAIELYQDHVHFVAEQTLVRGGWQGVSQARMRVMLDALIAGDGDAAAQAMADVLAAARDAIVGTLTAGDR